MKHGRDPWNPPPLSASSEPSEQFVQPDEEPDYRVVSDGQVPRVRNSDFRNVGRTVPLRHVGPPLPGLASAAPAPAGPEQGFVCIAPVAGRRFHIARDCDVL